MPAVERAPITVAVAGLGAIGFAVARTLDQGIEGLKLTAVSANNLPRATARLAGFRHKVRALPLVQLGQAAEVVVECVPASCFGALAEPVLGRGGTLVALSAGALLSRPDLIDLARTSGGRILVPSGAILGLDAMRAAAEGPVERVTLITRKPPGGLAGAPYLAEQKIDLAGLSHPLMIFEGDARAAARGFPANVNVAAALSLAGIGPERTKVQIWADPTVTRNCHRIEVEAEAARFTMEIENVPSESNPRTGRITALSVLATLRRLVAPLQVGT